jgi:hypothetical protein
MDDRHFFHKTKILKKNTDAGYSHNVRKLEKKMKHWVWVGFGDAREDSQQVRNCGLGNFGQFWLLLLWW